LGSRVRPAKRLLRVAEGLLWAVGLAALVYCTGVWVDSHLYQRRQSRLLEQAIRTEARPPAARRKGIPRHSLVGRLAIPRIGLSAMIVEGDDGTTLRRAVGHIPGTALPGEPGNVAIAGHRDTFFRPLMRVRRDDEVVVTTVDGVFRYRVGATEVVEPDDVQVLRPTERATLTLVTCYPFYFVGSAPKRFIVRAYRIGAGGTHG
jgi:sortase A